MAEIANTLWYRLGTISATDGSTKVTGVGTHFTTAGINPGATLRVDGRPYAYEVKRVVSDTELELATPYYGGNISAASYSIDRNFQSTTNSKLAADITDLVRLYEQVRDGTVTTIEGKSAYQVAVANGFKGTESEWLESLKGAGEITTINTKLARIYNNNAAAHNSVYRGKNLGTAITDAQLSAIRNGTFDDLYIGDYWVLPVDGGITAVIVGCSIHPWGLGTYGAYIGSRNTLCVWFQNNNWLFSINDTATTAGHFIKSKMYTETFPELLAKLETVISAERILPLNNEVPDNVDDNGKPNHWVRTDMKMYLPSRVNLGMTAAGYSTANYVTGIIWPYARYHFWNKSYTKWWLDSSVDTTRWHYRREDRSGSYMGDANWKVNCWPYVFIG